MQQRGPAARGHAIRAKPVEAAGRVFLQIIHRSEPQSPRRIDDGIIEAVVWQVRLDLGEQLEPLRRLVPMMQSALQPGDEASSRLRQDETGRGGRIVRPPIAGRRIEAVDVLLLDVDEPERRIARDPHRPLEQFAFERPDAFGRLRHQRQPASTK